MLEDLFVQEMFGWSDEEEMFAWNDEDEAFAKAGPIMSENEIKVLPLVPPVAVTLQPCHETLPVGVVFSASSLGPEKGLWVLKSLSKGWRSTTRLMRVQSSGLLKKDPH